MPGFKSLLRFSVMMALVYADFDSNWTPLQPPDHPRDILTKRNRDCGTFTMYCGGLPQVGGGRGRPIPMACANACYYINTFNPGFSTTYSSTTDNTKNRQQAGCQKRAGSHPGTSVCNIMPFSQKFHDPLENYSTEPQYNCDEFPMAEMDQNDFDPNNVPRNTLACIDGRQNSAAGTQLRNFIRGEGWYSQGESKNGGRSDKCAGKLRDGDTYKVVFNYDGDDSFDKSTIPFCKDDNGNLLKPESELDTIFEFYMTKLGSESGKIDFPYRYDVDNRYADAVTHSDIQMCVALLDRTGDAKFVATIYYGDNVSFQEKHFNLPNDGDSYIINPPDGNNYEALKIIRTQPIGTGDGTPIQFLYGLDTPRYYGWASDSVGADNIANVRRPDNISSDLKGRYCYWTQVDDNQKQTITCGFPCNSPA